MLDMKNIPVFNYTYPQEHYEVGQVYSFWLRNGSTMDAATPSDIKKYAQALDVEKEAAPVTENGKVFVMGVVTGYEDQGYSKTKAIKVMFKCLAEKKAEYRCSKFITGVEEPASKSLNVVRVTELFPNPFLVAAKNDDKFSHNGKMGKVLATHL